MTELVDKIAAEIELLDESGEVFAKLRHTGSKFCASGISRETFRGDAIRKASLIGATAVGFLPGFLESLEDITFDCTACEPGNGIEFDILWTRAA